MKRPRVLLADDHRMVAEGLKTLLEPEFDLVGIVEDGRALLDAAAKLEPDVVVVDISMPRLNGLEAIPLLRSADPRIRVVVITMHREAAYARRALAAGASGFVLKHSAPDELVAAIRAAAEGRTFVTPELAVETVGPRSSPPRDARDPASAITPRQREILQFLAQGKTAKEIAAVLGVSVRTVEFHKYKLMEDVGAKTSAELIRFAIRHAIVSV